MAQTGIAILLACALFCAPAFRAGNRASKSDLSSYTFAQYIQSFNRSYAADTEEYQRRSSLFEASLAEVHDVNARNEREGRSWTAGVHPFMDRTSKEFDSVLGYKPGSSRRPAMAGLQTSTGTRVRTFAESVQWETGPAVRDQGSCGSCWAVSAAEALEAQLLKNGGSARVSVQALVDCVPNPQHCGGTGGCDGATGELAYEFVRDHGIPLESDLAYTAQTAECPVDASGLWPAQKRVRVSSFSSLASNKLDPLMQALNDVGPVVVAVDGSSWSNYARGIFDGCEKDVILNHAVLAKGYGQDGDKKFWTIQNSWGGGWGEDGSIRLIKHDDEENWCGTDNKPQEGLACDGGPAEITVCGSCGLLYDPVVPQGVRLEDGSASSPSAASDSDAAPAAAAAASQKSDDDLQAALPLDSTAAASAGAPDAASSASQSVADAGAASGSGSGSEPTKATAAAGTSYISETERMRAILHGPDDN